MKTLKILRKRGFALFLALIMCLGLSVTAFAAEGTTVTERGYTLTATLDQYIVTSGAEDQYVTLSVSVDPVEAINWIRFNGLADDGLVVTDLNIPDNVLADFETKKYPEDYNNPDVADAIIKWSGSFANSNGRETITNIGTVQVKVPANTTPGDYTITMSGIRLARTGGVLGAPIDNESVSATLTVEADNSEPATVPVENVTLNPSSLELTEGATATLTAEVLPEDADDATVAWTSSNPEVATVDNGVVTAVSAGEATITAAAGDVRATCAVTVKAKEDPDPVEQDVFTFEITADKSQVSLDEDVTITVTVKDLDGKLPNGAMGTVTYDAEKFELKSGETRFNVIDTAINSTLATLTFTAKAAGSGTFGLSDLYATDYDNGAQNDAPAGQFQPITVTVVDEHTVTYTDENGETIATENVRHGGSPANVPETTAPDCNEFKGWQMGEDAENLLTAEAVKDLQITEDVTLTAVYAPCTYIVTVGEGLIGKETATYGTAYTVTIDDADTDNYNYTVTYTIGGTERPAIVENDVATIPGANIIGDMTVSVTKALKVEVEVYADYVTGYTLVLAKGNGSYTYGNNAMIYVKRYEANAWLVAGKVSEEDAKKQVTLGSGDAVVLDRGKDVNDTGKVDLSDAVAVHGCYKVVYDIDEQMALYLSADVTGDHAVNADDVAAVQSAN